MEENNQSKVFKRREVSQPPDTEDLLRLARAVYMSKPCMPYSRLRALLNTPC